MVVKAKRETRKFERLKFWITLTLRWIIKKDKTEETNIFTTCKVLLLAQRSEGFVFPKKWGLWRDAEGTWKVWKAWERYWNHCKNNMDTQNSHHNLWLWGLKSQAMSKYKSYNKNPGVKYVHNKIFLFIMMFSSFKVNNCIDLFFSKLASGRDPSNPAIWLVPRAGSFLRSCPLTRAESLAALFTSLFVVCE